MAVSLKHKFTLLKGDGSDPTVLRPSNWNDEHAITLDSGKLLGRVTAGNGAAEEIAFTTQGLALLNLTTSDPANDTFGVFETGDVKFSIRNAASAGWLMMNDGTIGSATSGANYANAAAWPLYNLLWTIVSNTYAPVTGGRGASAAADFAANKPIALTKVLGRALAVAGSGSGLSARPVGFFGGEENHTLALASIPPHTHSGTTGTENQNFNHDYVRTDLRGAIAGQVNFANGGEWGLNQYTTQTGIERQSHNHGFTTDGGAGLGGGAHNNIQPTTWLNCFIKL